MWWFIIYLKCKKNNKNYNLKSTHLTPVLQRTTEHAHNQAITPPPKEKNGWCIEDSTFDRIVIDLRTIYALATIEPLFISGQQTGDLIGFNWQRSSTLLFLLVWLSFSCRSISFFFIFCNIYFILSHISCQSCQPFYVYFGLLFFSFLLAASYSILHLSFTPFLSRRTYVFVVLHSIFSL